MGRAQQTKLPARQLHLGLGMGCSSLGLQQQQQPHQQPLQEEDRAQLGSQALRLPPQPSRLPQSRLRSPHTTRGSGLGLRLQHRWRLRLRMQGCQVWRRMRAPMRALVQAVSNSQLQQLLHCLLRRSLLGTDLEVVAVTTSLSRGPKGRRTTRWLHPQRW